jgi:ABC-type uncharacterized transport system permease subunit
MTTVLHYMRIAGALARVGIVRKSQLQMEFWCQVIMDCLWYASHVAVFEVLYAHVTDIAGWSRDEFRVLIGFLFVSDAFMMIWLSQMWRFGRDLKDGKLDSFRVRPVSTLFIYGFQTFSLEGCMNMLFAFGLPALRGVDRGAGAERAHGAAVRRLRAAVLLGTFCDRRAVLGGRDGAGRLGRHAFSERAAA